MAFSIKDAKVDAFVIGRRQESRAAFTQVRVCKQGPTFFQISLFLQFSFFLFPLVFVKSLVWLIALFLTGLSFFLAGLPEIEPLLVADVLVSQISEELIVVAVVGGRHNVDLLYLDELLLFVFFASVLF